VDSAFDSCLIVMGSNPAEAGNNCVLVVHTYCGAKLGRRPA